MKELKFRQIHLDFHTSPNIEGIGDEFEPKEFASMLAGANVNSISCFARGHHGMLYYDSKLFPERVHPYLKNKDLLKKQIDACHKIGIRVPIYITVQWDHYTAKENPQWLCRTPDGGALSEPFGRQNLFEPGFYGTLCLNSPYVDFLKEQTREVIEMLPVDGLFFDIVFPTQCSCEYCIAGAKREGLDPTKKEDRFKYGQKVINDFKMDMTKFVRQYDKDCTIFYNKGHIGTAHREVSSAYTHFELETLPSGDWGYLHFPITIRYARTLGLDCLAQTGKFHTMWGDFHSFKNLHALEFECFRMLALNSKCLIGDQLDPNGKLSKEVYELVGNVFGQVALKEPWCSKARAITDIGVFTPEQFLDAGVGELPEAIRGVTRMLEESGHQFDIIDSFSEFDEYKLLIMPDKIYVDDEFKSKLDKYLNNGGKIIASFESGLNKEMNRFEFTALGVEMKREQTKDIYGELVRGKSFSGNDYADYLVAKGEIGKGLWETEYVMYQKGLEIEANEESEVLVDTISSYFNRTYEHFCSHRQTPSSGVADYPGIVKNENTIYFSHPIFQIYNKNAPLWCKQLFLNAVNMFLEKPLLVHNGPTTVMATLNEQPLKNRQIAHLLHYIPIRRSSEIDIIEDVIPLYNVELKVKLDNKPEKVYMAPNMEELEFLYDKEYVSVIVPRIYGHEMIVFE